MIPVGFTFDDVREVVVGQALVATRTVSSRAWAQGLIIHKLSTLVEKTHGPCDSVCERRYKTLIRQPCTLVKDGRAPRNLCKDGPFCALNEFNGILMQLVDI